MTYAVDLGDAFLEIPDQTGLPAYSWRGVCRIPKCGKPANEPHHAIPRGRTGGPMRYVLLDGQLIPCVVGICCFHHHRLTVGESLLLWRSGRWCYESPERGRPEPLLPIGNEGVIRAAGGKHCPVCGRSPVPRDPYRRNGHARPRVAFPVRVPADAENGAEILALLAEQVGDLMGLADPASPSATYYALVASLSACLIDPAQIKALRNTG